jgi:hypothetical protein
MQPQRNIPWNDERRGKETSTHRGYQGAAKLSHQCDALAIALYAVNDESIEKQGATGRDNN